MCMCEYLNRAALCWSAMKQTKCGQMKAIWLSHYNQLITQALREARKWS